MNNSSYLPNLHGLRFIAAILVVINHVEQFKAIFNLPNLWGNHIVIAIGKLSVIFFFVLSGFLICHLMINEESKFSTISIKQFYIRRILRIWPLYFLIVLLGLFLFPSILKLPNVNYDFINVNKLYFLIQYCLFLPQIVIINCAIPFVAPTWSIGAEENFYFIWPFIFKYFKNKILATTIFLLLIVFITIFLIYINSHFINNNVFKFIIQVMLHTPIQCMFIGALGAFVIHSKDILFIMILKKINTRFFEMLTLLIIVSLIYFKGIYIVPYISTEIYAFLFLLVIINAATSTSSIINLENSFMINGGKLTYGIYLYHGIIITICIKMFGNSFQNNLLYSIILYLFVFLGTWILSHFSFKYFESFFMKLK